MLSVEEATHGGRLALGLGPERTQGFRDRPRPSGRQLQRLEGGERLLMPDGSALAREQPQALRVG
jgi:hypothetical protein